MRKWIKVAVPLGIAAVMLSVLAIGFGAPNSHAVKPGSEPAGTPECMGDEPEGVGIHGRAGSTSTEQFAYCSDTTLMLIVSVQWDNPKKDLALRVTEPDGTEHFVDHAVGTSETYRQSAPLPEGIWTVEVINNGNGSVKYGLSIVFAEDPDA